MEAAPVGKNISVFVPLGEMPSRVTLLRFYAVAVPLFGLLFWVIFKLNTGDPFAFYIVAFTFSLFFILSLLNQKVVSKISIEPATAVLEAEYFNAMGQQKKLIIRIQGAYYEYKLNVLRGGSHWRIMIYNNYFKNRLELRESKLNGFSKAQLDEIATVINELRK